jgi:hypothetical protein
MKMSSTHSSPLKNPNNHPNPLTVSTILFFELSNSGTILHHPCGNPGYRSNRVGIPHSSRPLINQLIIPTHIHPTTLKIRWGPHTPILTPLPMQIKTEDQTRRRVRVKSIAHQGVELLVQNRRVSVCSLER